MIVLHSCGTVPRDVQLVLVDQRQQALWRADQQLCTENSVTKLGNYLLFGDTYEVVGQD